MSFTLQNPLIALAGNLASRHILKYASSLELPPNINDLNFSLCKEITA